MEVLEIAIEKLKALPKHKQAFVAKIIEQIASPDNGVFHAAGIGTLQVPVQTDHGGLTEDDAMAALWKHCHL
jgi:hypothetical protein